MAKKRRKIFRRQADRSWKELKPRNPKPRRKPLKPKADSYRSKRKAWIVHFEGELKSIMRQAARVGAAEAIEHCHNFWNVSDGYKKYIDHQIETQSEALMAAVRKVVAQLILVQNRNRKQ